MPRLTSASDVWALKPTPDELRAAADYATVSLPWTFNRMMLNTGSKGQQQRGLNVAKGLLAQQMLARALQEHGVAAAVQLKSYRDDDLFDFELAVDGTVRQLDLKTYTYYTDYDQMGRQPFSPELLIQSAGYPGPDWRHFFPMMVAHTQIAQSKDCYCFAISSGIDFRRDVHAGRSSYAITAFPYGESMGFLGSKKLCQKREEAGLGFRVGCYYWSEELPTGAPLAFTINGEWAGQRQSRVIEVEDRGSEAEAGPFSMVSSITIEPEAYERLAGRLEIRVSSNDYTRAVLNTAKRNSNAVPSEPLVLQRADFCNLLLPDDYTTFFIGWIPKDEYLVRCRQYPAWIWPDDTTDRFENQPWTQITDDDRRKITAHGFDDCLTTKPRRFNAGWMKVRSTCYYYPNAWGQGLRETNLYVLPSDLLTMADLVTRAAAPETADA